MRGCIFIFNARKQNSFTALLLTLCFLLAPALSHAYEKENSDKPAGDDEIISGPFSEYGEFDSNEDEAEDEKFFQYGRFFGIGLGAGLTTATGNAGKLYQGGFPTIDFRLTYWFDFNFAMSLNVQNSRHNYDILPDGLTEVNFFRTLLQVKYYFDTKDLSAPITFVGPHLIAGGGFYQRTDNIGSGSGNASVAGTVVTNQTFGVNFGGGLELTLKPRKTYLDFELLGHFVQFSDQFDSKFSSSGITDRTGIWVTAVVALMWTW